MLVGGGQERGIRAGTENVLLIAGMGEACRIAYDESDLLLAHSLTLKHQLMTSLSDGLRGVSYHTGHKDLFIFNGPRNSVDLSSLGDDVKMFRAITRVRVNNSNLEASSPSYPAASHIRSTYSSSLVLDQLPNTVSVSIRGVHAQDMLDILHDKVACSAGSACHTGDINESISPVLLAMGVPLDYAKGTLRLSLGRHTTAKDIKEASARIVEAVKQLLK